MKTYKVKEALASAFETDLIDAFQTICDLRIVEPEHRRAAIVVGRAYDSKKQIIAVPPSQKGADMLYRALHFWSNHFDGLSEALKKQNPEESKFYSQASHLALGLAQKVSRTFRKTPSR